jgi:uncharacterized protein with HEPN domain
VTHSTEPRLLHYLGHILEAIERIERYTAKLDKAGFECAEQTQDAVIRNSEIIGEASRSIQRRCAEFAKKHGDVPWGLAYEMRNALSHGCFKVDLGLLWETIQTDLPVFAEKVRELRDGLRKSTESA